MSATNQTEEMCTDRSVYLITYIIVTQILWLGISDGVQRRSANYVEQSFYFDHVTLMVH